MYVYIKFYQVFMRICRNSSTLISQLSLGGLQSVLVLIKCSFLSDFFFWYSLTASFYSFLNAEKTSPVFFMTHIFIMLSYFHVRNS